MQKNEADVNVMIDRLFTHNTQSERNIIKAEIDQIMTELAALTADATLQQIQDVIINIAISLKVYKLLSPFVFPEPLLSKW